MAPWLLLSLSLAQSPDPAATTEAQRTQEQALQRQGEAQSRDGTLDGGVSPTGAPDPSLSGTGGAGGVAPLPGSVDAGTPAASPYTVPSPFPGTGGAGDAGTDARFAPGTGSTAPGSTGTGDTGAGTGTGGTGTGSTGTGATGAGGSGAAPLDTRTGSGRSAAAQPAQGSGEAAQPAASDGAAPTAQGTDDAAREQAANGADPAGTVSVSPVDIEGPASAATPEQAAAALRAQVQALQEREAALTARQEELAAQTQELQAQMAANEARAQELEAARTERLAALEDVSALLVDVDTALAVGESDVDDQMADVMDALAEVAQSAEDTGQGETRLVAERARAELEQVMDAVGRRDTYAARLAIQAAAASVRGARFGSLDQGAGVAGSSGPYGTDVTPR